MKPAVITRDDGRVDLTFHHDGRPVSTETLTVHEADDLLAILEQRKAAGKYCAAEDGEHTCVMPPGHSILAHVCRACTREWRTP